MSFVDDNPMRTSRLRPHFLNARKQAEKHPRAIRERNAEQVDAQRMLQRIEYFQNFAYAWDALRAAQRYKALKLIVIALGVKHANLIFVLDQPLDHRRHSG